MQNLNTSRPNSTNRFNPLRWSLTKQIAAATLGFVVLTAGWAAFRPEKLFVQERVNESFPAQTIGTTAPQLLAQGNFSSQAHHTAGNAAIYRNGQGHILRLSNFVTSNGPDVHVYLTKGQGTDNASIKAGHFLDLGVIKGNVGDQNYQLPADFDPADYRGISIWCARFGVGFGGADLQSQTANSPNLMPVAMPIASAPKMEQAMKMSKSVVVTTGKFHPTAHATSGTATITEDEQGNRTLTLNNFKTGADPALHLYLYKAEQVKDNATAKELVADKAFVDLGALKSTSGAQTYQVPSDIDLWQYLAVGVWCDKFDVNFATAPLSSPQ